MKPHKHQALIKAWADGAEIEYKSPWCGGAWRNHTSGQWLVEYEYRIKPGPKPDVVRWCWATDRMGESKDHYGENGSANLKITFDGETGKLKSAEIL